MIELHSAVNVILAFPGTGKSSYAKKYSTVNDLDSELIYHRSVLTAEQSQLSLEEIKGLYKEQNPAYPQNFFDKILKLYNNGQKILLCSLNEEIVEFLHKNKILFYSVFPCRECKEEYIERMIKRGNPEPYLEGVREKYDEWITAALQDERPIAKFVLGPGEFLEDAIKRIDSWNESRGLNE